MTKSRKIVLMLVSLLGAVVLWLYVVTNVATETTKWVRNIPIKIDGAFVMGDLNVISSQGKYYVITEQDIDSVSIELSTSRANMNKLTASTVRVTTNTSRASISQPGDYELDWTVGYPNTVRTSDVQIIDQSKGKVRITVDELVSDREIPIELVTVGTRGESFVIETESAVLDPAAVLVTGPKAEVDQIAKAVVTYDITNLNETVEETIPVTLLNAEGEELTLSELASVTVTETRMTLPVNYQRKLTPTLSYIEGPGVTQADVHATFTPKEITVKGPKDVLDQLGGLLVLDESVDLNTISTHWSKDYELELPAGVTNVSGQTEIHVDIRLSVIDKEVTIKEKNIRIINAPSAGLYPEIVTKEVLVTVRGHATDVQEIRKSSQNGLIVELDLSGVSEPGSYSIQGKVDNPNYPKVSVQSTVEIGVVITDEAPSTPE